MRAVLLIAALTVLAGPQSETRATSATPDVMRVIVDLTVSLVPLGSDGGTTGESDVALAAGAMTLDTSPWTVIEIDDEQRGSTPLYKERLLPGTYRVRFRNENEKIDVVRELQVYGGTMTLVKARFSSVTVNAADYVRERERPLPDPVDAQTADLLHPAYLSVDAAPWARVYLDGRLLGDTPLFAVAIVPGAHSVHLVHADTGLDFLAYVNAEEGYLYKVTPERGTRALEPDASDAVELP